MKQFAPGILIAAFVALALPASHPTAPAYEVVVDAGSYDRHQTPVTFALPDEMDGTTWHLVADDGASINVQVDGQGTAAFILPDLASGSSQTFRLESAETRPAVAARSGNGAVVLSLNDQEVMTYHAEETDPPSEDIRPIFRRGGYIHPVFTPGATLVTNDYPSDHWHHHGIWAAWTSTEYDGRHPDFWNMGDSTGTIVPVSLDASWSGPVHAGFTARHRYLDLGTDPATAVLDEQWDVRLYAVEDPESPYYLFDLHVVQQNPTDLPLNLPEYRYGGVGFRGHEQWNGPEHAYFLTSEGKDRSNGHATRARWCHIGGYVDGTFAGVGILGHPDNFRAPQPMRIHPSDPFFNWAPSQAGDWSIGAGETYEARYRFVVADGQPDADRLDALWNDYASPPTVTVRPAP